ncbi:hypothetical protein C0J52_23479 [Blattella germanica]|nr:hypothetical protein C0J52_23479 [Blattella germanica]
MDPAGVSGTVTVDDQKSHITVTLRGKNPTEIHRKTGRPKKDEQSVKLVADALGKNRRVTCVELSETTGNFPSVYRILTHDLKTRNMSASWVLHCLSADPKTARILIMVIMGCVAASSLQPKT